MIRDFKSQSSLEVLRRIGQVRESRKNWMMKLFAHAASRHVRNEKYQIWTHENHAIELHGNRFILQRIQYIHQNPVRAGIVQREEHYLYSSARNYHGKEGKIPVNVLPIQLMQSEMSFVQYGLEFNR